MEHSMILKSLPLNGENKMDDLQQSLELIDHKLDTEILSKQNTIDRQEREIQRMYILLEEKNKTILEINEKLADCLNNGEGNRQLINKLLGDISRLQQDLEWYNRTYEKRNLFGMIREKIIKKKMPRKDLSDLP
ncbi:MAG: hypothetical protein ACXWWD_00375 [Chitinophagaceae bacterium]